MAPKAHYITFLFLTLFATNACSQINASASTLTVLVGSTPCDSGMKSMLQIPVATSCDFIRWELILQNGATYGNTFVLNTVFGEAQPNTLGFKGGGTKRTFNGTYTVSKTNHGIQNEEIYRLRWDKFLDTISFVKLNENLFHLLTPSGNLMIGNGGWSYTLNRKDPISVTSALPILTTLPNLKNETWTQVIFDGRTPCQNVASEHQMNVSASCFKLKWRLILNKDPISGNPTTYTIRKVVDNVPRDVSGKWVITRGTPENTEAVVYQLEPDKPDSSISLFVGDKNVLFFLDKKKKLYVGNKDFSFTLNKRQ